MPIGSRKYLPDTTGADGRFEAATGLIGMGFGHGPTATLTAKHVGYVTVTLDNPAPNAVVTLRPE